MICKKCGKEMSCVGFSHNHIFADKYTHFYFCDWCDTICIVRSYRFSEKLGKEKWDYTGCLLK